MTRTASRDDILARVRGALAHDPALVDTRRRAALDYLVARVQNTRPQLAGDCLQLHGAIGFTWEHDCHLYLKRVRLNQALVRSNHDLRQQGFTALEEASANGRSLMEIGQ